MKYGLSTATIQKIRTVLSHYPQVDKATLYGSRAAGGYKSGSDIDLTLHGDNDLTLPILYRILDEIDDLFLPYTIDLSIFHNLTESALIEQIEQVGVTFYQKDEKAVEPA